MKKIYNYRQFLNENNYNGYDSTFDYLYDLEFGDIVRYEQKDLDTHKILTKNQDIITFGYYMGGMRKRGPGAGYYLILNGQQFYIDESLYDYLYTLVKSFNKW